MTADAGDSAVAEAIRAVRGGDRDAFAVVVSRYQRRMFGLALMMTRNAAAAEDVAQEALVRAFDRLHLYDDRLPFAPWISTITARLAQNWLVRRSTVVAREGTPVNDDLDASTTDAGPLDALIADEDDRQLWRAVSALPSGQRSAVVLHYRHDLKVTDVASVLGVTPGTIKTLLFRARQRLRRALADTGPRTLR